MKEFIASESLAPIYKLYTATIQNITHEISSYPNPIHYTL